MSSASNARKKKRFLMFLFSADQLFRDCRRREATEFRQDPRASHRAPPLRPRHCRCHNKPPPKLGLKKAGIPGKAGNPGRGKSRKKARHCNVPSSRRLIGAALVRLVARRVRTKDTRHEVQLPSNGIAAAAGASPRCWQQDHRHHHHHHLPSPLIAVEARTSSSKTERSVQWQ